MPRPKRTPAQREQDLAELAKLLRRGWSQQRAALHLGISQQQVSYDWKALLRRLTAARGLDVDAKRSRLLEEYREAKSEAWDAWERSKQNRERTTAEKTTGGKGEAAGRSKAVKVVEGRLPDPHYLRVVVHCLDRECELEAFNPPRSLELGGKGGAPIAVSVVEFARPPEPSHATPADAGQSVQGADRTAP